MRNAHESTCTTSASLPLSTECVASRFILASSSNVRFLASDCRVYARLFYSSSLNVVSRSRLSLWFDLVFLQFIPPVARYIYTYLYLSYPPTFETTSQTSGFVVSFNFDATLPYVSVFPHIPSRQIRSSGRKECIHVNFNLFGYVARPL